MEALVLGSSLGEWLPILAVGGGLIVAIVAIVGNFVTEGVKTRQREQTRREIAAYVAEGSMSPDEGERLMIAGARKK